MGKKILFIQDRVLDVIEAFNLLLPFFEVIFLAGFPIYDIPFAGTWFLLFFSDRFFLRFPHFFGGEAPPFRDIACILTNTS